MSYNNFTSKAILQLEDQASKESIRPTWMSPEPSFEQTSVDFDDSDEWAIKVRRMPYSLHFSSHSIAATLSPKSRGSTSPCQMGSKW